MTYTLRTDEGRLQIFHSLLIWEEGRRGDRDDEACRMQKFVTIVTDAIRRFVHASALM